MADVTASQCFCPWWFWLWVAIIAFIVCCICRFVLCW